MNYFDIAAKGLKNFRNLATFTPGWLFAELMITYSCTQRCRQCNIPERASRENTMSYDHYRMILDKLSRHGSHGVVITGGEPTSHPEIEQFLLALNDYSFLYKNILSNLYFSPEKMERLTKLFIENKIHVTTSFDGLGETADLLRGAKNVSDRVMRNMEYLSKENAKAGSPLRLIATMVVSRHNAAQIPEIMAYLKKIGWALSFDVYRVSNTNHNRHSDMMITDPGEMNEIIHTVKKSSKLVIPRWILNGFVDYMQNKHLKYCPYIRNFSFFSKFFIQPDGDVHSCNNKAFGNILRQDVKDIFSSVEWRKFRDYARSCSGCWNSCHTPYGKISGYFNFKEVKQLATVLKKKQTA